MWNRSAVCLVFLVSLYQVLISGFDVTVNDTTFHPEMYRRKFSSHEIKDIIDLVQNLINSSAERERQEMYRELVKGEQHSGEDLISNEYGSVDLNNMDVSASKRAKKRVKRQGTVGKFTEAAKPSNLKTLRIYLTMFKNLWSPSYVGGAHPLHPDVPGPVVKLYREKFMHFFFPPVGADAFKE